MLSYLSVGLGPESCLRVRPSSLSRWILPLHREFHSPLPNPKTSSFARSPKVRPWAFTDNTDARLRTLYAQSFRRTLAPPVLPRLLARNLPGLFPGSWHDLYPGFGLYEQMPFITHAVLLDQAFAHCPIFPTAASQRSLGRVSVPVWLTTLSGQRRIVGLVRPSHTNYLILPGLIPQRCATPFNVYRIQPLITQGILAHTEG